MWPSERQRMIKRARSEKLEASSILTEFQKSLFHARYFRINFECLRVQIETISGKRYLRGKKTQNVIQNLQVVFAIASNREGKPVCECPTHADLERTPNENDEHSPDRSRPYRSKIWSSSGKMRSLPPEETEISVSLKWAVAGPGCLPPKNVHTGHPR